jgi:hypothetical protein
MPTGSDTHKLLEEMSLNHYQIEENFYPQVFQLTGLQDGSRKRSLSDVEVQISQPNRCKVVNPGKHRAKPVAIIPKNQAVLDIVPRPTGCDIAAMLGAGGGGGTVDLDEAAAALRHLPDDRLLQLAAAAVSCGSSAVRDGEGDRSGSDRMSQPRSSLQPSSSTTVSKLVQPPLATGPLDAAAASGNLVETPKDIPQVVLPGDACSPPLATKKYVHAAARSASRTPAGKRYAAAAAAAAAAAPRQSKTGVYRLPDSSAGSASPLMLKQAAPSSPDRPQLGEQQLMKLMLHESSHCSTSNPCSSSSRAFMHDTAVPNVRLPAAAAAAQHNQPALAAMQRPWINTPYQTLASTLASIKALEATAAAATKLAAATPAAITAAAAPPQTLKAQAAMAPVASAVNIEQLLDEMLASYGSAIENSSDGEALQPSWPAAATTPLQAPLPPTAALPPDQTINHTINHLQQQLLLQQLQYQQRQHHQQQQLLLNLLLKQFQQQ